MSLELLTTLLLAHKYTVIAPLVFFLGAPVSLVAGILLRAQVLELLPTCAMLAIGELAADVCWYWLGIRHGESFTERFGSYMGISRDTIIYTKQLFERRHHIIIFTSKITAGLGFGSAIMFTAGLTRVPFGRYMMLNIAGQTVWTAALLATGYFLSHLFVEVNNAFNLITSIGLALILAVILFGLFRYLRAHIAQRAKP